MLFGLLSLLMGHWTIIVAKICINSPAVLDNRFYPCMVETELRAIEHSVVSRSDFSNKTSPRELVEAKKARFHDYCPQVVIEAFTTLSSTYGLGIVNSDRTLTEIIVVKCIFGLTGPRIICFL